MTTRQYEVLVDNWGANPQFIKGQVIEVDDEADEQHRFPYDAVRAEQNGVVREITEGVKPTDTLPVGLLPSGAPVATGAPAGAVNPTEEVPMAPADGSQETAGSTEASNGEEASTSPGEASAPAQGPRRRGQ